MTWNPGRKAAPATSTGALIPYDEKNEKTKRSDRCLSSISKHRVGAKCETHFEQKSISVKCPPGSMRPSLACSSSGVFIQSPAGLRKGNMRSGYGHRSLRSGRSVSKITTKRSGARISRTGQFVPMLTGEASMQMNGQR